MEANFFIQFYNPKTATSTNHNELSDRVINQSLVQSMVITSDFLQGKGKTISLLLKNPRNIFNSDYTGNSTNVFGETLTYYDWTDYFVPDGQFFVAKGTKAEWDTLSDDDKTARLMGIFRINRPVSQMLKQTLNVQGQDIMKFLVRGVAYHNTKQIWQYPPNDWGDSLISVGQIVHDVFHKLGVYHYHKDGHIDNDSDGPLTPDGEIFYSTNMYFRSAEEKSDEQIFDIKHPYDFIKKFVNYTGYSFYIEDKVINGTPQPVFYFKPCDYSNDTTTLFGTSEINFYNAPSTTHADPIKVLDIKYGLDDNDIREYVITTTGDSSSIVKNGGQSGARMRNASWMIGVIQQPDIKDFKDSKGNVKSSIAKAIGQAVMGQIEHFYRNLQITFNNWIKFKQRVYNMNIGLNDVNVHINDYYLCKSVSWVYNKFFSTTASFSYFSEDNTPKVVPTVVYTAGDGSVSVYFPQVGADSYNIYQDGTAVKSITPSNGQPIYEIIDGLTNGTSYDFCVGAVYNGIEVKSDIYSMIPEPNDDSVGGGHIYLAK